MNIGAIARQTGIEVATLRKWESRYGFPIPERTVAGHRDYPAEVIEQLLTIRRNMSGGQRPGKAIKAFLSQHEANQKHTNCRLSTEGISLLVKSDTKGIREWLVSRRKEMDAADFVEIVAAPMAREVGNLWAQGQLPVFAEHVFSEEMQSVLLSPQETDARQIRPRILLTAPAGEKHTLGLRMAGAVLSARGEPPLYITTDLPTPEIVIAAIHYGVCVVGLTASLSYPPKLLLACLKELRQELPVSIQLWAGGAGTAGLSNLPENITQISNMQILQHCLQTLPLRSTD